ncbi:MAG: ATP-binding protein [Negativicutes bacterium]|nr:ATP-binding protein [Negativicutes bacterium]
MPDPLRKYIQRIKSPARQFELFFFHLIEKIPVGILIVDCNCNILYVNKRYQQFLPSLSEEVIIGKHASVITDILGSDYGEPLILSAIEGKEVYGTHRKAHGGDWLVSTFPLLGHKENVLGGVVIVEDIAAVVRLGDELRKLERLNVIGEMAASIGHEIRNPMTTIRGFLQYYSRKPEFSTYVEEFDIMVSELDRANDMLVDFLSLAKNKTVDLARGSLNAVLTKMYPLLEANALERGLDLKLELGGIGLVMLDEKDIRQLVLNLVHNGFDAIKGRGSVTIKTCQEEDKVILEIKDSGGGIPQEVLNQLGSPFVTTKEKGTGLGLPACFKVAERHSANIEIDTGPEGTTFFISFNAV